MLCLNTGAELPDEGAKFTGDADLDFIVMELSFSEHFEAVTQAQLGLPGKFSDPPCGTFLTCRKLSADFRRDPVVGGLFDEDPPCVRISTFADPSSLLSGSAGVFGGDEAEEGHELLRMLKAAEGSNLGHGDHGGNEFESFEGHEGFNEGFALPVFEEFEHGVFDGRDAPGVKVDGAEVVLEDDVVGDIREGEVAQVSFVGFGPVGLSGVVVSKSTEHGEKAGFGTTKVIDGIGSGTAKVADGFVNGVGDVDGDKVVGAEHPGEFGGVAFIGLDPVTGLGGNE